MLSGQNMDMETGYKERWYFCSQFSNIFFQSVLCLQGVFENNRKAEEAFSPLPTIFKFLHFKLFFKRQILDSRKMKEFADDNFKFDENGRKFFKRVKTTVGKREIACFEQFLLFPQCYQKCPF